MANAVEVQWIIYIFKDQKLINICLEEYIHALLWSWKCKLASSGLILFSLCQCCSQLEGSKWDKSSLGHVNTSKNNSLTPSELYPELGFFSCSKSRTLQTLTTSRKKLSIIEIPTSGFQSVEVAYIQWTSLAFLATQGGTWGWRSIKMDLLILLLLLLWRKQQTHCWNFWGFISSKWM